MNLKLMEQLVSEAGVEFLTKDEWERIKEDAGNMCAYCSDRDVEITKDHVIPLSRGGLHTRDNVVPCCKRCNGEKGNRTPEEWGIRPYWWREE